MNGVNCINNLDSDNLNHDSDSIRRLKPRELNQVGLGSLVGKHQTSINWNYANSVLSFKYWYTDIVRITSDEVILNNGGWYTSTTKRRMNQIAEALGFDFKVYQKNYNWYAEVNDLNGKIKIFCFQQNEIRLSLSNFVK
tara:strand:- start:732 stop:1148 length:417 start_codon:yes stop_codon:yes gene_type:complete